MKSILGFICFCLLCSIPSRAQDSTSFQSHRWALDFGVRSLLQITSFQGASISIGNYVSDHEQIRLGCTVYGGTGSNEQSGSSFTADTLSNRSEGDTENDNYSIEATVQYLAFVSPAERTSIYFGIGPMVGFGSSVSEGDTRTTSPPNGSSTTHYKYRSKSTLMGALVSCGVEWFFSEHISAHAEYQLGFFYSRSTSLSNQSTVSFYPYGSYSYKNENTGSGHSWNIDSRPVLVGLSVKF